jgi:Zn-dependent protease with chaperone function
MDRVAYFYDGQGSSRTTVRLKIDCQMRSIKFQLGQEQKWYRANDLVISPRLGSTPRRIETPDGCILDVPDNEAIDQLINASEIPVPGRWIHRLESKFRYVILSVVITVLFVWLLAGYGIPVIAKHVAFMVPVTANSVLGEEVLTALDQVAFSESQLSMNDKQKLTKRFFSAAESMSDDYKFRLVFRRGGKIGANAFALPGGTVILTDELVEKSQMLSEVELVLAHELGHVINRHSLRQVLQSSTVALLIMAITGDVSSAAALAGALPTVLVESHYSREFEKEADRVAYDYAISQGISPRHFINLLDRLSDTDSDFGFLSTHPSVQDRSQIFSAQ